MITVYHNPRCSKSRETLALLRARNVEPEIVEYLKTPPDAETLRRLTKSLGGARAMIRDSEKEYRALGLDDPSVNEEQLIAAMVRHPVLIQRPIVVNGRKAAIGRPPEAALAVL